MIHEASYNTYLGHGEIDERYYVTSDFGTTREEFVEFFEWAPYYYHLDVLCYGDPAHFDSRARAIMAKFQKAYSSIFNEVWDAHNCGPPPFGTGNTFKMGHLKDEMHYLTHNAELFLDKDLEIKRFPKRIRRRICRMRSAYQKWKKICKI